MRRMNDRMSKGFGLYQWKNWSEIFARSQWKMAKHILKYNPRTWAKSLSIVSQLPLLNITSEISSKRAIDRVRMRWADNIKKFCENSFPDKIGYLWQDVLVSKGIDSLENYFVNFITTTTS